MAEGKKVEQHQSKTEVLKALETQTLKPKQPWFNIDTGDEEDVQLTYDIYKINEKAPISEVLRELNKLVTPDSEKANALVAYANTLAYRKAKADAEKRGNYMSAQLRSTLVSIMRNLAAYADLRANDCFDRWKEGMKAKKPGAQKLLDIARKSMAEQELADF